MGIKDCSCNSSCFACFRAKFKPNDTGLQLQQLPKPKEAEETDGLLFIDSTKEVDILIIRNIDACIKQNGTNHNTSRYELMMREFDPELVVRRGQPFAINVTLSRPYDEARDAISFIFTVDDEDKPSFGQGTLIGVPLMKEPDKSYPWNVVLESSEENILKLQIIAAPDCVVAKWRLDVDTKIKNGEAYSYSWSTGIYILFNPWCKRDQVYLKSDEWRKEGVLADVGLIYRGTFNRIRPCIWKYQQFEKSVLECSLYIIKNVGKIQGKFRNDPVLTSRALSAAVNSVDDDGVVMGNWSENFNGGSSPTSWIGSMEILQKYYKKKQPVKFGQCWVFSGVLTTICRAIGIPSRTITNYKSAHDTQSSLTVDYFMDKEGAILEELNSDSIWNFHVWNEVWMERPDLGRVYGGWQAIDATPQEQSEDMYRVGPTSLTAVKLGEIKRPYDTGFLFAEVNADKVYWRYSSANEPLKLLGKDIHGIGKLIITKTPGKWQFDDVTIAYKHAESADEERNIMFKALRQSENLFARYYLNEDFNDIKFSLETRDDVKIGQPFNVCLVMQNRNMTKDYCVGVTLRVDAVAYTGKPGDLIKQKKETVNVKPDTTREVTVNVSFEEYQKKLLTQAAFNVSCLATVCDTKFEYYTQDEFSVRKPDIRIVLLGAAIQNQVVGAEIHLENPLPIPLKKCEFTVDVPGFDRKLIIKVGNVVAPGKKALGEFKFIPKQVGNQTIAAKFVSKELQDVDGFLNFVVQPAVVQENGSRI